MQDKHRRETEDADMKTKHPDEEDLIRLIVTSWVAQRTETPDMADRTELDRERPDWECEASRLIAEGLLAYVFTEMVEPDLALQRQTDPHAGHSDEDLVARLAAHMLDFIDYRDDLPRVAGSSES
jgi:hypothetical protein